MKKIIISTLIVILSAINNVLAEDYDKLYNDAKPLGTRLYNDIDPFEDEDSIKYAYSPYPLFRTSAYLYFKDEIIAPGYYSIAPRKLKDNYYLLFKQGGKVKYIIPVVKKEATPINFYKANLPQRKKNMWEKVKSTVGNTFYKLSSSSQKVPPPNSYIKVDVDVRYITVSVYYGEDKYISLFRRNSY